MAVTPTVSGLTRAQLKGMKLQALKDLCRKLSLPVAGRKVALVLRLSTHPDDAPPFKIKKKRAGAGVARRAKK